MALGSVVTVAVLVLAALQGPRLFHTASGRSRSTAAWAHGRPAAGHTTRAGRGNTSGANTCLAATWTFAATGHADSVADPAVQPKLTIQAEPGVHPPASAPAAARPAAQQTTPPVAGLPPTTQATAPAAAPNAEELRSSRGDVNDVGNQSELGQGEPGIPETAAGSHGNQFTGRCAHGGAADGILPRRSAGSRYRRGKLERRRPTSKPQNGRSKLSKSFSEDKGESGAAG